MKKARIAIDITELEGKPTGVGRYIHTLLKAWSHLQPEVHLVLYHHGPAVWPLPENLAHELRPVSHGLLKAGWYFQQRMLAKALNEDKPDLLFAPAYSLPLAWRGRSVVTVHDLSFEAFPGWFPRLHGMRMRYLTRRSCQQADEIIAVSNFSRDEIVRLYGVKGRRISVIYHGVDVDPAPPAAGAGGYFLMLGSLFERRYPLQVLDAFAKVRQKGIRLVIVGDDRRKSGGDFQQEIEQRGLRDAVIWRRYVEEQELRALLTGARGLIYLSRYEGFGLPPLEAMAAGVPAIVSARGALREIYKDHALLVQEEEPGYIADAVLALSGNESLYQEMRKKGMERAAELTVEKTGRETLEVLLKHV